MKQGNRIGLLALILLAVAVAILFGPFADQGRLVKIAILFEWMSVPLSIYAGFKGSRWWFAIPVAMISLILLLIVKHVH